MRRFFLFCGVVAVIAALFLVVTVPRRLDLAGFPATATIDGGRGERIFWAGGCTSCHAVEGATGAERLKLGGGAPLKTTFGTFYAPNISPDPIDGIGRWSLGDFANAMQRGVDPEGRHLYPSFPYTSYIKMTPGDVADLFAFMKALPKVTGSAPANDLTFPFNIRRGIGLWKLFFLGNAAPIINLPDNAAPTALAGRYLVEGPGHCGQCHSPRGLGGLGGLDTNRWLAGAASPEGRGRIPNITPVNSGIGGWSAVEIADYLKTGFTPDYDSVGGSMAEVQANIAKLPAADRESIAAYLKAIPARE